MSTTVIIEYISWLMKVNDNNDARCKPEIYRIIFDVFPKWPHFANPCSRLFPAISLSLSLSPRIRHYRRDLYLLPTTAKTQLEMSFHNYPGILSRINQLCTLQSDEHNHAAVKHSLQSASMFSQIQCPLVLLFFPLPLAFNCTFYFVYKQ